MDYSILSNGRSNCLKNPHGKTNVKSLSLPQLCQDFHNNHPDTPRIPSDPQKIIQRSHKVATLEGE